MECDDDRWCPQCDSELHFKELIGGGYHYYCMEKNCDYQKWEEAKEDCPVCHGAGATTDHHDPCTECGGSGKVGGEE